MRVWLLGLAGLLGCSGVCLDTYEVRRSDGVVDTSSSLGAEAYTTIHGDYVRVGSQVSWRATRLPCPVERP